MAVVHIWPPDPMTPRTDVPDTQGPVRTCIGCRTRTAADELLRVVAAPDATGTGPDTPVAVVPDPRHRLPGRGAWLHLDQGCADLAQRRRAFGRALRVSGVIDPRPVCEYVAQTAQRNTA